VGDPVTFEEAVRKLFALREYPPNRNDLRIPDDDDVTTFTHFINTKYAEPAFRTKHPETSSVLSRLTADEAKTIMGYTAENPYPLYKWLNAWLMAERQQKVIDHCGPYFVLLYRALEKLDKKTLKASRGIRVNKIPALVRTFRDYESVCAVGNTLHFWGFSSFSTKDDVASDSAFLGAHNADAIAYSCPSLTCVSITPLSVMMKDEAEVLPLPPTIFKVISSMKVGQKLVIAVEHLSNHVQCYVVPRAGERKRERGREREREREIEKGVIELSHTNSDMLFFLRPITPAGRCSKRERNHSRKRR
jgi:hypothetical protein